MNEVWLEILKAVITIVAPIVSILLIALMRKGLKKAGLEENKVLDELVEKHAKTAVDWVERVAVAKLDGGLKGESKSALAVKTVMAELKKAGITTVAEEFVRMKIESVLESKDPIALHAEKKE